MFFVCLFSEAYREGNSVKSKRSFLSLLAWTLVFRREHLIVADDIVWALNISVVKEGGHKGLFLSTFLFLFCFRPSTGSLFEDFLQVYMLSWLERKAAATLYATPPTSTVEEAMQHFFKANISRANTKRHTMHLCVFDSCPTSIVAEFASELSKQVYRSLFSGRPTLSRKVERQHAIHCKGKSAIVERSSSEILCSVLVETFGLRL